MPDSGSLNVSIVAAQLHREAGKQRLYVVARDVDNANRMTRGSYRVGTELFWRQRMLSLVQATGIELDAQGGFHASSLVGRRIRIDLEGSWWRCERPITADDATAGAVVAEVPALPVRATPTFVPRSDIRAPEPDPSLAQTAVGLGVTWGTELYVRHELSKVFVDQPAHVDAGIAMWKSARAGKERDLWISETASLGSTLSVPSIEDYLQLYDERLAGSDGAGAFRVGSDLGTTGLHLFVDDWRRIPVRTSNDTLSIDKHRHEWSSTLAHRIAHSVDDDGLVSPRRLLDREFTSDWNKALGGHPGCLRRLGLPEVRVYALPVAWAKDDVAINGSGSILITRTATLKPHSSTFKALQFFLDLYGEGVLPLASENDVRRFVMALASPHLRYVCVGLLGVYWILGASGSGKDFLAQLLIDVWREAVKQRPSPKVSFDISLTDDHEQKRSMFAADSAVYARAKEAQKRSAEFVDLLIRLSGTAESAARGMRRDEILVPMTATIVAESAEDLPRRKEISRRAIAISTLAVDAKVSLGAVLRRVLEHAADIVADLQREIETKTPEWFTHQTNTGTRPVAPVGLAQLFGATLDDVQGRDLGDLFETMLDYTVLCADEGKKNQAAARDKDGGDVKAHPHFAISHFLDTMRHRPGAESVLRGFRTQDDVKIWVRRETDYDAEVKAHGFMRRETGGAGYAFKFLRDYRMFLLVDEKIYRATAKVGS